MSGCFVERCTEERIGIVTNQPDAPPLHPTRAHSSVSVCDRHLTYAKGYVRRKTGETGVFLTDAECRGKWSR